MAATKKLIMASLLGATMLVGVPMTAYAQDGKDQKITLDMEQVDVREALRALFKSTGFSYSIAPEVQGTVTVNLHGVMFETALQNILKQVSATYRFEGGVYQIVNREVLPPPPPINDTEPKSGSNTVRRRVPVGHADPMFIALLIGKENTNFTTAPEISTVLKTPAGGGGGFGGGFGGGNGSGSGNNGGFRGGNNGGNGGNNGRGNNRG